MDIFFLYVWYIKQRCSYKKIVDLFLTFAKLHFILQIFYG